MWASWTPLPPQIRIFYSAKSRKKKKRERRNPPLPTSWGETSVILHLWPSAFPVPFPGSWKGGVHFRRPRFICANCLAVVYTIQVLTSRLLIIFISFFKKNFYFIYMYVCPSVCATLCVNSHRGHRGLNPLECKPECGCEPPDIGAENQSWVLSQGSKWS